METRDELAARILKKCHGGLCVGDELILADLVIDVARKERNRAREDAAHALEWMWNDSTSMTNLKDHSQRLARLVRDMKEPV